jgi:predicted ATPase
MERSLDKLSIRGFKSIRNLEDFELKSVNVLVGANGAGKTSFISFFRMLSALIDGRLDDYVRNSGGVSDLLFNGRKTTEQMEFSTSFGPRGYRFNIKPGPDEGFAVTGEALYYEDGVTGWWELGSSAGAKSLLVEEAKGKSSDNKFSKPVYEAIRSWKIYHFHDTSSTAAMRHAEIVEDNESLRSDAKNIAPFLLRLREEVSPVYQELLDACRLVTPYLDDFILKPQKFGPKTKVSLTWRTKGSDYPMQPYQLSDGSMRFICLATALLQPDPPATLIIDEPELSLHPEAIYILAELIQSASKRTQLIIATQSPLLLDQFSVEDIVVVNRKEGESYFERLSRQDYSVWLEDYSVGQLWTKNVINGGAGNKTRQPNFSPLTTNLHL